MRSFHLTEEKTLKQSENDMNAIVANSRNAKSPSRVDSLVNQSSSFVIDLTYYNINTVNDVTEAFEQKIAETKGLENISCQVGLKLGYNNLTSIAGLFEIVSQFIPHPDVNLLSLDLCMNKLTAIEPEILKFRSLKSLYLHGNNIQKITEARKLAALENLTKLTMHGNNWIVPAKTKSTVVIGGKKTAASSEQKQQKAQTSQNNQQGNSSSSGDGRSGNNADSQQRTAGVYFRVERLESTPNYRDRLVWMLRAVPLKSLDNALVSERDRTRALQWANTHPVAARGPVARQAEESEQ